MKSSKIGGARYYSNIVHFESTTTIGTAAVAKTIEIEPIQGHAIVIDQCRATLKGFGAEETSSWIHGIVSVDENQAVVDADDEDTIYDFVFDKDRTTTGISQQAMESFIKFDRGIPTSSRALRMVVISDNAAIATHELNVCVEYHYEPINKAMMEVRGV